MRSCGCRSNCPVFRCSTAIGTSAAIAASASAAIWRRSTERRVPGATTSGADPALANVVPFRTAAPVEPKTAPSLTPIERRAFRELAQELTSRLRGAHTAAAAEAMAQEAMAQEAMAQEAMAQDVVAG